jgi:hypothetical protein
MYAERSYPQAIAYVELSLNLRFDVRLNCFGVGWTVGDSGLLHAVAWQSRSRSWRSGHPSVRACNILFMQFLQFVHLQVYT